VKLGLPKFIILTKIGNSTLTFEPEVLGSQSKAQKIQILA